MMNLEKLGLSTGEMLQRSQLASIIGGNDQEEDGWDIVFITCDCSTGGESKMATCSEDLVNMGGNLCCQASYGSSSQQSGC